MILLYTTDKAGTSYIRTDQLDGETDWKIRRPVNIVQQEMNSYTDIGQFIDCVVKCEEPSNKIYNFTGIFKKPEKNLNVEVQEPIGLENTLWADTVVASQGFVLGLVIYTGKDTRSAMNKKSARSKMAQLDNEVNFLSKLLFSMMGVLALAMTALNGVESNVLMYFTRLVLLLSSIIPISLRVNLDMAKLYYSYNINTDDEIIGTVARNSNIPEDLGRLSYLITDKTGTLTKNEMVVKKVYSENSIFNVDDKQDTTIVDCLKENVDKYPAGPCNDDLSDSRSRKKRDMSNNLRDLFTAFSVCNNVTPVIEDPDIDK